MLRLSILFFKKYFKIIFKFIFSFLLVLFLLETLIRFVFFFPTNVNIFKYGIKKTINFNVVDLSRFQISVFDNDKKDPKKNLILSNNKFWIFGGSTSFGYNCENGQSSSWPEEINKLNRNFKFKNFAFNGADSDQQLTLFQKEIHDKKPGAILWASKFNTLNITRSNNYRNKHILKYEFQKSNQSNFFIFIKELDKSLKSYSILYTLFDVIIQRINLNLKLDRKIIKPSKQDLFYALKNFKINTLNAINISKENNIDEFFIISLFHDNKNYDELDKYRFKLYKKIIYNIQNDYYPYVKIIDLDEKFKNLNKKDLLCDSAHQTLKGNMLQGKFLNNELVKKSKIINE